jgi:hypothetical protein
MLNRASLVSTWQVKLGLLRWSSNGVLGEKVEDEEGSGYFV